MKYAHVPEYILSYKDLNATERLLMGIIYSLTRMSGECFATNEYFSNTLGFTTRTISSSISSLKRENLIVTKNINGNRKIILTEKFNNNVEK